MMRCPNHLEIYRVTMPWGAGDACNGILEIKPRGLRVLFSDGEGWEHVSVSRRSRMPTYEDLDEIKREFWSDRDTVMQLFVPRSDHVNCHPYCLHLWRPTAKGVEIPRPPSILVGRDSGKKG